MVRIIKETACYIANDPKREEETQDEKGVKVTQKYKLPDGNTIDVIIIFLKE